MSEALKVAWQHLDLIASQVDFPRALDIQQLVRELCESIATQVDHF